MGTESAQIRYGPSHIRLEFMLLAENHELSSSLFNIGIVTSESLRTETFSDQSSAGELHRRHEVKNLKLGLQSKGTKIREASLDLVYIYFW